MVRRIFPTPISRLRLRISLVSRALVQNGWISLAPADVSSVAPDASVRSSTSGGRVALKMRNTLHESADSQAFLN
jgi:hypothetical protein